MPMAPLRRHRDREESLEERLDRDTSEPAASGDLLDVPAAVVCVRCGEADCGGCEHDQSRSGVVAIVAWERPMIPAFTRLWSTARSSTRDAESFFEALPDGPVIPALRFAALCEIITLSTWALICVPIAAIVAPEWLRHVATDPGARSMAVRAVLFGIPAFAMILVAAHAAHGLSINRGATKNGARSARTRALRFGLYACGWDLVIGPVGAVVVALKEGLSAMFELASLAADVPSKATKAFLRGCYRIEGDRAKSAHGTAFVWTVLLTGACVVVVGVALIALVLA
jgi:hypothetical protein